MDVIEARKLVENTSTEKIIMNPIYDLIKNRSFLGHEDLEIELSPFQEKRLKDLGYRIIHLNLHNKKKFLVAWNCIPENYKRENNEC